MDFLLNISDEGLHSDYLVMLIIFSATDSWGVAVGTRAVRRT